MRAARTFFSPCSVTQPHEGVGLRDSIRWKPTPPREAVAVGRLPAGLTAGGFSRQICG